MKRCTGKCKKEKPESDFSWAIAGIKLQSQCKKCLRLSKKPDKPKPKVRKVEKIDSDLANEFTRMRWV